METLHVPVSVLVTLLICVTTLAWTTFDPSSWTSARLARMNEADPAWTTQCERLTARFLKSGEMRVEDLVSRARRFAGAEVYKMILGSADEILYHGADDIKKDRLFYLRGKILETMGRYSEATTNFRAALRWNRRNDPARRGLVARYIHARDYDMAMIEIRKGLALAEDKETKRFYTRQYSKISRYSQTPLQHTSAVF